MEVGGPWGPLPFLLLTLEAGPHILARESGRALKLPQRVWAKLDSQTYSGAL